LLGQSRGREFGQGLCRKAVPAEERAWPVRLEVTCMDLVTHRMELYRPTDASRRRL
jgi:hypothetical protein